MTIVDTVEEIQTFLEDKTALVLIQDEPDKFLQELKSLLEDVMYAADNMDSAVSDALYAVEEARSRAEDAMDEAQNAISELENVM